jgi:hypothetical protein
MKIKDFSDALVINNAIVRAEFVRVGLIKGPAPGFSGIRLGDVEAAREIIHSASASWGDGSESYDVTISEDKLARAFAWAVVQAQS